MQCKQGRTSFVRTLEGGGGERGGAGEKGGRGR